MKIVAFGTGPFCVPTLEALINSDHDIAALVTRPIDDPGKRRKTEANPVRALGEEAGLDIFSPASCNDSATIERLSALQPDLLFVCDYGQILSSECLETARLGGINLHGSLLPKYRGSAPVQWAIFNGETSTGATVIHMTPAMDAGPILASVEVEIEPGENAGQLEQRLSCTGVTAVMQAIDLLASWDGRSVIGQAQDPKLSTKAPRLQKSDGQIDWSRTAAQIVNQIRAFQPWPMAYCNYSHGKRPLRLIIHGASPIQIDSDAPPGVVVAANGKLLAVQTGDQALSIEMIQPAGKKPMPIADFLRGHQIQIGQTMD